jgi:hypothetical protein
VTKTLGLKALTLVAGLGLSIVLVSGCNPEEPAKTTPPSSSPPPKVAPAKPSDTKGAAPAPAPAKKD